MTFNLYTEKIFDSLFNVLNSWITKFEYFACIRENNVIVLFVEIRFLVKALVLTKLMFSN
jgi:hypothetical protein